MSDNSNTGLMEQAVSSGVQQAGGNLATRAVNWVMNLGKKAFGRLWVDLGPAFSRYIDNAYERYNHVKTLATGEQPRVIIGEDGIFGKDSIYVSISAQYKEEDVDTDTVEPLLKISKHLVIEGTGGIGKSMLLRYLFLKTAMDGHYIPVLLTLRKISNQTTDETGKIDLFRLIDTCMAEFKGQLPREQFEYSLDRGKYLFLLDGLDEVKQELASKTIEAIQVFCQQYPDNPCIITSRPWQNLMPLETFTVVQSGALRKAHAVELASKLDPENEKTDEFCRQLKENLFDRHEDFAENPLLLGMMFLTFRRTNSIPDHLADFYGKTFDALYSLHDSTNKGTYQREFHCKELNEPSFRNLLAHFCFHSYFQEDYEFSKDSILSYIEKGIQKLGLSQVRAQDYMDDLCDTVCILVKEGNTYRFSHRSFQAYFAALYTRRLSNEQQKHLFAKKCFSDGSVFLKRLDYCYQLTQMDLPHFATNALEDMLRDIQRRVDESKDPDIFLLLLLTDNIIIRVNQKNIVISFSKSSVGFFIEYFVNYVFYCTECECRITLNCSVHRHNFLSSSSTRCDIPFEEIDSSELLTNEERTRLYAELFKAADISEIRTAIRAWLQKLDEQRANLQQDDFLESL